MPPPSSPIEIPFSKTSLIWGILGCLLFIAFGYLLIVLANFDNVEPKPALISQIMGWCFIGGFGLLLIINLRKLIHQKIGLIIDERGITDYVRNLGLIEWQDIEAIENFKIIINFFPIKYLLIKVHNPEKYIDRTDGNMSKMMLKMDKYSFKTPISISSMPLKCSFSQMEQWVREGWERSKQKS